MKVKVGDTIYDGEKEPVVLILSDQDKKNIANMSAECTMICQYPTTYSLQEIDAWMGPSPTGQTISVLFPHSDDIEEG